MPAVHKTRRAGVFEVPSSRVGVLYTVEVDVKAPPGTALASLPRGCVCVDHVRRRPTCKHAGA
eukprot:7237715-Alexandrium_andersonii.AAC.1